MRADIWLIFWCGGLKTCEKDSKKALGRNPEPFIDRLWATKYFLKDRQEERKMKIKRWRERIIAQILGMKVVEKRKVGGNVQLSIYLLRKVSSELKAICIYTVKRGYPMPPYVECTALKNILSS